VPHDKYLAAINENKYVEFYNFLPIDQADQNSIVFCSLADKKGFDLIMNTKAKIVLAQIGILNCFKTELNHLDKTILFYKDSKLAYIRILNQVLQPDQKPIVDRTARIDPDAKIGKNVNIGAFSIIGKCEIGENSSIETNSVIYDRTKIGKNVKIGSTCNIGSEGFGFAKTESGSWLRFPHIGRVVIEDDVEIFSFCDVSRGTLGDTVIRRGTKISFQVHVAHNCDIGENCILTAAVRIAGSTAIGENCFIGNGSVVRNNLTIGKNVTIGAGAVVVKDIPDGLTVVGNPAEKIQKHANFKRSVKHQLKNK
jgi:UDP-3-O-[3-hydroxymyristoyl] glucosamine N-acyltransferase